MKCFVGHKGEGEGFFGSGGDAEIVGRDDLNVGGRNIFELACSWHLGDMPRSVFRPYMGCERGFELRHDERVFGAAAGDDELIDSVFWQDEAIERVDDGQRGEDGDCTNKIGRANVMVASAESRFLTYAVP